MTALLYFVSKTISAVLLFIPAVILTYLFYIFTAYKNTPEPNEILPIYLFAVGIQMLHFAEEYIMGFCVAMPELVGQSAYPLGYWVVFNMVAYFIFLLGGIVLFKRIKRLMIIPLFFILTGVVLNGIAHVLISIYLGSYFPGLYTAILYLLIAPMIIGKIRAAAKIDNELIKG